MNKFKGFIIPISLIIFWQLSAFYFGIQSDTLSDPLNITIALLNGLSNGLILTATAQTLTSAGAGLLFASILGISVGILFGLIPQTSKIMRVTVEILRPIPAISIVPIAILVFGFGYVMEISIVSFACFFPILLLTENSIQQISPRLLEVARVLSLSQAQRITKIIIPASAPRIFIALRLAAGLALIVAVTVEITANPSGLGYQIMIAGQSLRPADMFALLFWIGLLGWMLNYLLLKIEIQFFPNHGYKEKSS